MRECRGWRGCAHRGHIPAPGAGGSTEDFALFDAEIAILFDYDAEGRVRGYQIADDPETVGRCAEQYARAVAAAVPLAEFVAASRAA